mgnify:CR=1 FL=1
MEKSWLTPDESEEDTDDESPPLESLPQEITEPSSFSAAKAYIVVKSWLTPEESCEATSEGGPPLA